MQCTTLMGRAALLTSVYFRPVDVIGRPIANKGRINGASLKAAGSLLPGHGLITVSLAFALIGGNKGSEVEWMEGISISITGRGHKVLSNLRLYTSPLTLQTHTHTETHTILCLFFSLISYSKYTRMHIYFLLVSGSQTYWNEVVFQKTETETLLSKKYLQATASVAYIMKMEVFLSYFLMQPGLLQYI